MFAITISSLSKVFKNNLKYTKLSTITTTEKGISRTHKNELSLHLYQITKDFLKISSRLSKKVFWFILSKKLNFS